MEPPKKKARFKKYRGVKAVSPFHFNLFTKPQFNSSKHSNPLADKGSLEYPISPDQMNWASYYPNLPEGRTVDFADVGCGFGGLLVSLGETFPDSISVGLELRTKVVTFVEERIEKLRSKNPGKYNNVAVLRANAMKYIPNYFNKGQVRFFFDVHKLELKEPLS